MIRNFKYPSFLLVISLNEINIFIRNFLFRKYSKSLLNYRLSNVKITEFHQGVFLNQIQKPEKSIILCLFFNYK